jgi:hypothetical protein
MSLICSLTEASPRANTRRSCRILHCRNGSVIPVTSCSGAYPDDDSPFKILTKLGTTGLKMSLTPFSSSSASSASQRLATNVIPHSRTPWFRSCSSSLAFSRKCSCRSGTFRQILMAHRAAFRRMYGFELDMMVSTSGKRSRAISTEAMFPSVQSARPTMYWLEWFRSLFSLAFSASCRTWLRTSWLSWSPRSRPPGSHPVATWSPDTPSVCPQNAGRPVTLDIRSVQNVSSHPM